VGTPAGPSRRSGPRAQGLTSEQTAARPASTHRSVDQCTAQPKTQTPTLRRRPRSQRALEEAKAVFKAAAVGDKRTQAAHEEAFLEAAQVGGAREPTGALNDERLPPAGGHSSNPLSPRSPWPLGGHAPPPAPAAPLRAAPGPRPGASPGAGGGDAGRGGGAAQHSGAAEGVVARGAGDGGRWGRSWLRPRLPSTGATAGSPPHHPCMRSAAPGGPAAVLPRRKRPPERALATPLPRTLLRRCCPSLTLPSRPTPRRPPAPPSGRASLPSCSSSTAMPAASGWRARPRRPRPRCERSGSRRERRRSA
jgi:hypothetical protein